MEGGVNSALTKQMFAANPLRSDLHDLGVRRVDAG